jgi:hypothetical protein
VEPRIGQDAAVAEFLVPARSADDWQRLLAEPDKHWRTGYSAKALAHCWQSAGDFPPSVRAVFNASPIELFQGITMLLGIPERRVPLPGRGKASQTDLFVLAKSGDDLVSIAVEGKVAEPFDVLSRSGWSGRARPPRARSRRRPRTKRQTRRLCRAPASYAASPTSAKCSGSKRRRRDPCATSSSIAPSRP